MDRLLYIAMSGAKHTLGRQDSGAHNLANAASSGYRAEEHRLRAVQVLSQALPTRAFVVDASVATDFTPSKYCGADVCVHCHDHKNLARCYCGCNLAPGERLEDDIGEGRFDGNYWHVEY